MGSSLAAMSSFIALS